MGKNKMKTKKAASKRLKRTGSGKLMHRQTGASPDRPGPSAFQEVQPP